MFEDEPFKGNRRTRKHAHAKAGHHNAPSTDARLIESYLRVLKGYSEADTGLAASALVNGRWEPRDTQAAERVLQGAGQSDIPIKEPSDKLLHALKSISSHKLHGVKLVETAPGVEKYEALLRDAATEADKQSDEFTANRWNDIKQLHPLLRLPAIDAVHALEAKHIRFQITDTYRQPQGQDRLVREGNSYAPEGYSMHGLGMALDIVPLDKHGRPDWHAKPETWKEIRDVMVAHGFTAIGSWDLPHYQAPINSIKAITLPELPSGWKMMSTDALSEPMKTADAAPIAKFQLKAMIESATDQTTLPKTPPMPADATYRPKPLRTIR